MFVSVNSTITMCVIILYISPDLIPPVSFCRCCYLQCLNILGVTQFNQKQHSLLRSSDADDVLRKITVLAQHENLKNHKDFALFFFSKIRQNSPFVNFSI